MDIERELADEAWRKEWRRSNERALISEYRKHSSQRQHTDRLEWENLRKKLRDIFGDAYLDGVPIRSK